MRTRVKVCCITSIEEARIAIDAGADAIGFVGVTPANSRTITDTRIAEIAALVPPPVATFLLTAARTAEAISTQIRRTHTSTVQILSHLDPEQSARLADLAPHVQRVQVIHVEGSEALDRIALYTPHVNAFLLDSGSPDAAEPKFGGTGQPHDWNISTEFVRASQLPVFLAGGLSAINAADAIRRVRPFGLDLCSGVRSGGNLDANKLKDFMRAVQRADDEMRLMRSDL